MFWPQNSERTKSCCFELLGCSNFSPISRKTIHGHTHRFQNSVWVMSQIPKWRLRAGCRALAALCCECLPKQTTHRNFRDSYPKDFIMIFSLLLPYKHMIGITLNLANNADKLMRSVSEIRLQLMKRF